MRYLLTDLLLEETDQEFIERITRHRNSTVLPGSKIIKNCSGSANKCETNVFYFIKEHPKFEYYPVKGFGFYLGTPIEHWWVYNKITNRHIELTPMSAGGFDKYIGIIGYDVRDKIFEVDKPFDIPFFKAGNIEKFL